MLIPHKGHTDTIQVYSVTVMTHVKPLQAGHSSQGTSEPITPVPFERHQSRLCFAVMTGIWSNPHIVWVMDLFIHLVSHQGEYINTPPPTLQFTNHQDYISQFTNNQECTSQFTNQQEVRAFFTIHYHVSPELTYSWFMLLKNSQFTFQQE